MKILVLNANSNPENTGMEEDLAKLKEALSQKSHEVKEIVLRDRVIKDCVGCFSCWFKTPGVCIHKDGFDDILRDVIFSDLVLLASDIVLYHFGPIAKSLQARMIPLNCAMMEMKPGGLMGHISRYPDSWKISYLIDSHGDWGDEERALFEKSSERSQNYLGTYFLGKEHEEVLHAIDRY